MSLIKKIIYYLNSSISPLAYLNLQKIFYIAAFIYYAERQLNFYVYFSPILVTEFHNDLVRHLAVGSFSFTAIELLWYLHIIFLAGLLAGAFNLKNTLGNIFLYCFNFLLLILNYASGYAADIFIQIGLFFYIFGSLGQKKLNDDAFALVSLLLLRLYLGANYIFSAIHKIVDYLNSGSTFLETFALIQSRNQVFDSLIIREEILNSYGFALFVLILTVQVVGGGLLLFRRTSSYGLLILASFHIVSMPLLNLFLFPLISILLLTISCISANFSLPVIFSKWKNNQPKSNIVDCNNN